MIPQSARDSLKLTVFRTTLVHCTMVVSDDFCKIAPLIRNPDTRIAGLAALEKLDSAILSLCEFIKAVDGDLDAEMEATEEKKEQTKC